MAAKRKPTRTKSANGTAAAVEPTRLRYTLAELPTSQHKAGLAGLVLHVRWIARQPNKMGRYELLHLDERGATFEIDGDGLKFAFDDLYAASKEEVRTRAKWKGADVLRVETEEQVDDKGRTRTLAYNVYTQVVPRGSLVLDLDAGAQAGQGPWVKLWRDFIWQIMRGVPAQRRPFEARATASATKDHLDAIAALTAPDKCVPLASTYFLGAQDATAEDVPFKDRPRFRFLLHFWPLTVPIYVPQAFDAHDGKYESVGFAVTVPDLALLETYTAELPDVLRARPTEIRGYRPAAALVDIAAESALDFATRLRSRLGTTEGAKATGDLVHAFDVFHVQKQGNNVRLLSAGRVHPDNPMIDEYARLSGSEALWDPLFRRQRVLNLLAQRPWYDGFDALLARVPAKTQGFGSAKFRRDARITFDRTRDSMTENEKGSLEQTIYRMCRTYVSVRLKQKKGLVWEQVKDSPRKKDYEEEKEKIARDAFLAIRGRRGEDFLEYFAGTIGSVPHHLGEDQFVKFTRLLRENPDDARTLTLLALSAAG